MGPPALPFFAQLFEQDALRVLRADRPARARRIFPNPKNVSLLSSR